MNEKYLILLCIAGVWGLPAPKSPAPQCVVSTWGPWQRVEKYEGVQRQSYQTTPTKDWDRGRHNMQTLMELKAKVWEDKAFRKSAEELGLKGTKKCTDGLAGGNICKNIDQVSLITYEEMGYDPSYTDDTGLLGSDIWGWTDPETGDEYALMCNTGALFFIRITDPEHPQSLGAMYDHAGTWSWWRDVKVIGDWAYIGSESPGHGMQIFDLKRLRGMNTFVQDIKPDNHYAGIGQSHNIVANEETETIFVVGAYRGNYEHCDGGLHVLDVKDPMNPVFEGCFDEDGYTHDAQCVIYRGPDARYYKREICFAYNEDSLTIVDVTDRKNMKAISKVSYEGVEYTHQGWLTEDHAVLLLDDEYDEIDGPEDTTKTYVWDVTDLKKPELKRTFYHDRVCVDHNQYIKGRFAYQSNYACGLVVMYVDRDNMDLKEVGHFDINPPGLGPSMLGTWSNYPYYPSGNIVLTAREFGMYVVRPNYQALEEAAAAPPGGQSTEKRYREVITAEAGATCPALVENRVAPSK